ncbi:MAG: hypothetical protein AB4426_06930 [Xenococcaceae cyanobacterium]
MMKAGVSSELEMGKLGAPKNNLASLLELRRKKIDSFTSNCQGTEAQDKNSQKQDCLVDIQESAWEIYQLLKQQKTAVRFQKVQVLYLIKTGQVKTVSDLANIVGVHQVTMREWLKKYLKEGVPGLLEMPLHKGLPPIIEEITLTDLKERLTGE